MNIVCICHSVKEEEIFKWALGKQWPQCGGYIIFMSVQAEPALGFVMEQ